MSTSRPQIDRARIADFCRRHQIRRLALFGSVLRDDFGPDSNIDVLVEFDPGARIGWDFITIQDELSALLGRTVDLLTVGSIRPAYREEILSTAEDVYISTSSRHPPGSHTGIKQIRPHARGELDPLQPMADRVQ
ncbi:MAG: nucleotidyltransferase family protein [Phycisphaerae bacterium]